MDDGVCELTASDEWLSSGFETALIIITYETGSSSINGMTVADMELTRPPYILVRTKRNLLFKIDSLME